MAYFKVLPYRSRTPAQAVSQAYLLTDAWDDWFKYSTLYSLVIFDEDGARHAIGGLKIGEFAMAEDQRRPRIPDDFDALDERFFSRASSRRSRRKPSFCRTSPRRISI